MSRPAVRSANAGRLRYGQRMRVAFVGPAVWLDGCAPDGDGGSLEGARFPAGPHTREQDTLAALEGFSPEVTVVLDPARVSGSLLADLPGSTLGVLVDQHEDGADAAGLEHLDRVVCFDPALTGTEIGGTEVWRAIPPPVSDLLYADVRELHHAPRAISIGRSSEHREAMLMPAKHHHDLLQVIHGVSGAPLRDLLGEADVGVYVAREDGGGFGLQVGMHLASGQLLLAEQLRPAHGLERDIDYLHVHSPEDIVWILDRLARFPEMYRRVRVRGRLKAEQYRASGVFGRLAHDLVRDLEAFGSARTRPRRAAPSPV